MDEEHLVVQRGIMLRDTRIMPRAKVQALHLHQGPLMRWYGISRLYVFVADSVVALPVLEDSEAQRLFDRLSEGTFAAKTG
jgi:membrane protein YdbS with pleckstrin-like domain